MNWGIMFFVNSVLFGLGLSMDAFSISLANGLNEPLMKKKKMTAVAGIFGVAQGLMPMLGWICVHTIVKYFSAFEKFIPWIALVLLSFIGIKMLVEGLKQSEEVEKKPVTYKALLFEAVATSIDALSVGFTIAEYKLLQAVVCAVIIMAVTFFICLVGVHLGKKVGTKFSGRATVFGGLILILVGIEIFITGII
ncbi:MAG: manganese efflux pump [Clostridia bacterium]|nr:manganese efflux pump [Clostridia bacterium]